MWFILDAPLICDYSGALFQSSILSFTFLFFLSAGLEMQFSTRLFVSLIFPAAITLIISLLWLKKKSQEADVWTNEEEEDERKENQVVSSETGDEAVVTTYSPNSAEETRVGSQTFASVGAPSSGTESVLQDSGIDSNSTCFEFKESSAGEEESTSEGSVDSNTLLSFTEPLKDASPPLEENGKSRKSRNNENKDVWEIEFPQILCGRLIGRKGKNVRVISEKSGAKIRLIPQSPGEVSTHRIISVTGSPAQIQVALDSIHEKFPCVPLTRLNLLSNSGMEPQLQMHVPTTPAPQSLPFVQAMLPSVANFDVVVTSVVDAGHFFVQLHNDFMQRQLQDLHQNMLQCYGGQGAATLRPAHLPQPIVVGWCCAAPAYTYDGWYRAQVLGPTGNPDEVEVKYLDYGGYGRIAASSLRQLR